MGEKRTLQELDLIDDFLFTEALTDDMCGEYIARLIIKRVTGLEVEHLVIEQQKVVNGMDTDKHGIRMDVAVKQKNGAGESAEVLRFFDTDLQYVHSNILRLKQNAERGVRYIRMRDWFEYQLKIEREEVRKETAEQVTKEVTEQVTKEVTKETSKKVLKESIVTFLEEYGTVPENAMEKIKKQEDIDILKKWNKISARVESVEEFLEKIKETDCNKECSE